MKKVPEKVVEPKWNEKTAEKVVDKPAEQPIVVN
jgi:hypothetical protein